MKRIVTIILIICIISTCTTMAFATTVSDFTDVKQGDWFYGAVKFVTDGGIFNGTSTTTFSPDDTITRGMFTAVLGRYAGIADTKGTVTATSVNMRAAATTNSAIVANPSQNSKVQVLETVTGTSDASYKWHKIIYNGITGYIREDLMTAPTSDFTDVNANSYYSRHIHWAVENNIGNLAATGTYTPEVNITREEISVMLYDYLTYKELSPTETEAPMTFTDSGSISADCTAAVEKMQRLGVVKGFDDGSFRPQASATRAEVATMLERFINLTGSVPKPPPPAGGLPSGEPDGTTIAIKSEVARVGLNYYYSSGRNTTLTEARLENQVGSGYRFGYYDSNRVFHALGSTAERTLTVKPTGSGREVSVYITNSDVRVYHHISETHNLAIQPISDGVDAVTWFKGKAYHGDFEYYRYLANRLTVINIVDIDNYTMSVTSFEMSEGWPLEALKAQVIAAKTYFLVNLNGYAKYGFDVTGDTYSQAYGGIARIGPDIRQAVAETNNEFLTYNGALCSALYFSSSGGGTENSKNVFGGSYPYLVGVLDPYEKDSNSINSFSSWTKNVPKTTIEKKIRSKGYSFGTMATMEGTHSATGNLVGLKFTDTNGKVATFNGPACFNFLYSSMANSIHATFEVGETNVVFTGGGWGHSVGMSQYGAHSLAKHHGANYRQILRFYYTGANISQGV